MLVCITSLCIFFSPSFGIALGQLDQQVFLFTSLGCNCFIVLSMLTFATFWSLHLAWCKARKGLCLFQLWNCVLYRQNVANVALCSRRYESLYRESTYIGHTVYFQNAQDLLKCVILKFFHPPNIINTRNYILNVGKIDEKAFLNVLYVL